MNKEILELLKQIQKDNKEFRNEIKQIQEDNKEFRTEVNGKLDIIKDDLSAVEVVTSKNWNDIAKLKAIK